MRMLEFGDGGRILSRKNFDDEGAARAVRQDKFWNGKICETIQYARRDFHHDVTFRK